MRLSRSILAIGFFCVAAQAFAAIPASERAVLLNLFAYTDGSHWDPEYQGGWNGPPGTECTWYGITCDATDSTVIGINLAGVGMNGALPSLAALSNLQTFDMNRPRFRRHLGAIHYGINGGVYEWETVHG